MGKNIFGKTPKTIREEFYDISIMNADFEVKKETFMQLCKKNLAKHKEVKLPMQLFEDIFNFNFHRGVKHPISSTIVRLFKKNGLKVSKVRNKYLVRIKKKE